ncbi:MAG: efflux RND transporter periplasmic adaptor subunit [Pseudomonadota bacterium]
MRFFSILTALTVTFVLAMSILARPQLLALLGMGGAAQAAQGEAAETPTEASAPAPAATREEDRLVKVRAAKITARQINSAVVLRGQTEAIRQVDVRSETSAVVISDPLRKGAQVEKGDEMCVLDPGTRQASLEEARARLTEAQSRVPEAEARVEEAQARLDEAMINQNAAAKLSEDGFASQTRLANADAAVAAARAGVTSSTAGLRAARSGIEAATAAVASAEKEIERLTIVAPFSGLLESDTAELGSLLQPGALCATIIQLNPIKLVAFLPETEVNRVSIGAPAGARLAAGGQEVRGAVTFISRSADMATRTFRVEIEVDNAVLAIRDGQTAEIAISSAGASAHLLPQSALTLNDDGVLGVRTVGPDDIVGFSPVTIMRDTTEGVWVQGLKDTVGVILVGQEFVTAGVKVAPTWQEMTQ